MGKDWNLASCKEKYTAISDYLTKHVKDLFELGDEIQVKFIDKEYRYSQQEVEKLRLKLIEILCFKLDTKLYLPMKHELASKGITHSLGSTKEDFKGTMEEEINKLFGVKQ